MRRLKESSWPLHRSPNRPRGGLISFAAPAATSALRKKVLIGTLLIIALVLPMWPSFEQPALSMDEGALLVYPELILKGQLPYRDFETFYGPANPLLLSAVYVAIGPNVILERVVGLAYRALILVAFFALIQRWNTMLAAGCTAIAGVLMIPTGVSAFAWIGAVAAALASICLATKVESARRCFCAGSLAGLALLFRPDLTPAVLGSGLPLVLLMPWPRRWNYLVGATLGLLPFIALTIAAGPQQMMNNLLLFPVFYSSPGRHLPIFSADGYVIRLFFMHLLAMFANIITGFVIIRRNRADISSRLLLSLAVLSLGLTHQAAQRLDFGHVISAALLSISVLPLSIFVLYNEFRTVGGRQQRAIFATVSVLATVLTIVPNIGFVMRQHISDSFNGNVRYAVFVRNGDRSFPIRSPRLAMNVADVLNRLNSLATRGERLFVGPADLRRTNYNDTFFYYLLPQLRPATYFLEMNPWSANRPRSRLASDVASADWLVLSRLLDTWNEPNESSKFGSDAPMRVVQEKFQLCARNDAYSVYRRRASEALLH